MSRRSRYLAGALIGVGCGLGLLYYGAATLQDHLMVERAALAARSAIASGHQRSMPNHSSVGWCSSQFGRGPCASWLRSPLRLATSHR